MCPDQARGKKMRQNSFSFSSIILPPSATIAGSVAILNVAQAVESTDSEATTMWLTSWQSSLFLRVYEPEEPESVATSSQRLSLNQAGGKGAFKSAGFYSPAQRGGWDQTLLQISISNFDKFCGLAS